MCEKCDADFAGMSEAELDRDIDGVARIAAHILGECIAETPHGVVIATAVGDTVAKVGADMLGLIDDRMTPKMRELAERIGAKATEKIIAAYRETR